MHNNDIYLFRSIEEEQYNDYIGWSSDDNDYDDYDDYEEEGY